MLWPGSVPFAADEESDAAGFWWRNVQMSERSGTHLDAPRYLVNGGADVAAISAERLVVPALRCGIVGPGIDTLSVDACASTEFPVHHTTLSAGLWHLEGLVGLEALPPTGATLVVGALKLPGGSGTPARVFALG